MSTGSLAQSPTLWKPIVDSACDESYERSKRILDWGLALGGLIALAPLLATIAGLVRITSGRPIIFAGERLGRDQSVFRMYKFRTMRLGSDRGPAITRGADPRVTPFGRLLRRTKLDELPQLVNVVRGDMSFVGPRPEAPKYLPDYSDRHVGVLSVRPGITGPSQIIYRHEERMLQGGDFETQYRTVILPAKLDVDVTYLQGRSLRGDMRLLLDTFRSLFEP